MFIRSALQLNARRQVSVVIIQKSEVETGFSSTPCLSLAGKTHERIE